MVRIDAGDAKKRLDAVAAELTGLSRSQVQRLIREGNLLVNGKPAKPNYAVRAGDRVEISFPEEVQSLAPEDIPVPILFGDDHVVVVDKPAGLVVYPAAGHSGGTLMNALAFHVPKRASIGGPLRPGVVHRLDKDTSGVMVIAVEDAAYYHLVRQFSERTIERSYRALVYGGLGSDSGRITRKIGRSDSDRKKMSTATSRGKEAETSWQVVERLPSATYIEARLATGRTHQIRVHFASIGHPVLGDRTYGKKTFVTVKSRKIVFPRQMLHAERLGFVHPATGEFLRFTSPLPEDMEKALNELRGAAGF